MSTTTQSPAVVIATRNKLIQDLASVGGPRLTEAGREQIADWMITSGYLAETYYEAVAAGTGEPA